MGRVTNHEMGIPNSGPAYGAGVTACRPRPLESLSSGKIRSHASHMGGRAFFSPCISLPPMVCIWNRNSGLAKRMLKNAASPGGRTPAARVSFRITCRCQRFRLQHAGRSALCQFQPSFAPQSPPRWQQAESLTVYAIVNTLTEIAGIERVQILIENERSDTLTGHINLTEPLQRDYTILGSILI